MRAVPKHKAVAFEGAIQAAVDKQRTPVERRSIDGDRQVRFVHDGVAAPSVPAQKLRSRTAQLAEEMPVTGGWTGVRKAISEVAAGQSNRTAEIPSGS